MPQKDIGNKLVTPAIIGAIGTLTVVYTKWEKNPVVLYSIAVFLVVFFLWETRRYTAKALAPVRRLFGRPRRRSRWHDDVDEENLRAIFVYGSLLSAQSLKRSILRSSVESIEYIPARLKGYRLAWRALSLRKNLASAEWESVEDAALESLILEPAQHTDSVEGALILATTKELHRLKLREKNYSVETFATEIECLSPPPWPDSVVRLAFVPKPIEGVTASRDAAVRQGYYDLVSTAYKSLKLDNSKLPKPARCRRVYDADHLAESVWRENEAKLPELYEEMRLFLRKESAIHTLTEGFEIIPTAVRPIVLNRSLYQEVRQVAEAAVSLSVKAVDLVLHRTEFMTEMGYDEEMIHLAKLDCVSAFRVPAIARVDMNFDRDELKIFEVNSDSPGGMFHFDKVKAKQSEFCQRMNMDKLDYSAVEQNVCQAIKNVLRDRWLEFTEHEKTPKRNAAAKEGRLIAIVEHDWKRWPTRTEFEYFSRILKEDDVDTCICGPEELEYREGDGRLWLRDRVVDQVYKRALLADIRDAVRVSNRRSALIEAYENDAVSVVNSFRSRLAGNKLALALMFDERFEHEVGKIGKEMSDTERQLRQDYLLWSMTWGQRGFKDPADIDRVLRHCEDFVLKSFDGFGASNVYDGATTLRPRNRFQKMFDKHYIIQRRHPHGVVQMPVIQGQKLEWEPMFFILGAYVVNGTCVGIEAKVAHNTPVTMSRTDDETPRGFRTAVIPTAL